eukprot:1158939-Pelagomonas_calceolata.AAC.8
MQGHTEMCCCSCSHTNLQLCSVRLRQHNQCLSVHTTGKEGDHAGLIGSMPEDALFTYPRASKPQPPSETCGPPAIIFPRSETSFQAHFKWEKNVLSALSSLARAGHQAPPHPVARRK